MIIKEKDDDVLYLDALLDGYEQGCFFKTGGVNPK